MGKFRMPTTKQFWAKKFIYDLPKRDPVWVYIEKEMLANVAKKPYNEKVGKWLRFLKELKYYYYCERKKQLQILTKEIGPSWFVEFSSYQKNVLGHLIDTIKQDLIEDVPARTRKCLADLGITVYIPRNILMKAMNSCVEDVGIFIWNLYTAIYKKRPSERRGEYDMNAMILMSALVFIDLDECIERLNKLIETPTKPTPLPKMLPLPKQKKQKKYAEPEDKYGVYLQKMHAPIYCNYPPKIPLGHVKPPQPIEYKIKLRTQHMEIRLERNRQQLTSDRICTYKFWKPPKHGPRVKKVATKKPQKVKTNILYERAKVRHICPLSNTRCNVGTVAYVGSGPVYVINCVNVLPTGYIMLHGGVVRLYTGEYVFSFLGHCKEYIEPKSACMSQCSCMKWEPAVMKYVQEYKCTCHHYYDFRNEGSVPDEYFYPPTRNTTYRIDTAKIFDFNPTDEFDTGQLIKDTIEQAVRSRTPTPEPSLPPMSADSLTMSELLATLLADLSESPLIIPHLPEANKLNILIEWVRSRRKGGITPSLHKTMTLRSMRRWLWLKRTDYRKRSYRIPFTQKQLHRMDWTRRPQMQSLYKLLLNNFITRNRLRQLEQTRIWWSTMKYDMYPCKQFLDVYFTYMPGRMRDTYVYNPYSSVLKPECGGKTCPLRVMSQLRIIQ